jgi:hypothetical protein
MPHCSEDDLILYYYGEARRPERIEQHLASCEACAAAYGEATAALAAAGNLQVPERDERYGLEVWQRIRHELPPRETSWGLWWYRPALAAGVAVVVVSAFAIGRVTAPAPAATRLESPEQAASLADLRVELREMRQMLTLSLMQQQSASERLRGVSGSMQIDQPGAEIVRALLDTLMHDPNVNVRLASVDALRRFSMQAVVREGTVEALNQPDFPLVQIALIDFLVETKDTDAVDALRRLSEDSNANQAVRSRAVWGMQQLNS